MRVFDFVLTSNKETINGFIKAKNEDDAFVKIYEKYGEGRWRMQISITGEWDQYDKDEADYKEDFCD